MDTLLCVINKIFMILFLEFQFQCIILFQMKSSDGEIQSDPITVWYRSMHNAYELQYI